LNTHTVTLLKKPNPEVVEKTTRRKHSADYKRQILEEVANAKPGQIGEILRREGLYSSTLTDWRRQLENRELGTKKIGRPNKDLRDIEIERLNLQIERLNKKLHKAGIIIDVQKKLSDLLGIEQPSEEEIVKKYNL
jgi:transposase